MNASTVGGKRGYGGLGGMLPQKIFEKSVQLGAFFHIFMHLNYFSESVIFQQAKS